MKGQTDQIPLHWTWPRQTCSSKAFHVRGVSGSVYKGLFSLRRASSCFPVVMDGRPVIFLVILQKPGLLPLLQQSFFLLHIYLVPFLCPIPVSLSVALLVWPFAIACLGHCSDLLTCHLVTCVSSSNPGLKLQANNLFSTQSWSCQYPRLQPFDVLLLQSKVQAPKHHC